MLDTDQLRSFLAIVDTGSFTRAAERVNKTQSAVSMHIRRLEEQLERPLFAKQGRGARLTSDGERLIEHARRMLRVEAEALHDLKREGLAGRVMLGLPEDYAQPFLPDIVGRFRRQHPLVELSVVCHTSIQLAELVMMGEVDVAVVTDCHQIKGVEILREEPLLWVAGLRTLAVEEQRPLPLAVPMPACTWRTAALSVLETADIPFHLLLMSNNYGALAPIVQAGLALTILPQAVVDPGAQRVVSAPALPELPAVRLGLIHGAAGGSREAIALADVVRASIATSVRPAFRAVVA